MIAKEKRFYVYMAYYRGLSVYVGKGVDKRRKHTFNGQSGSELINDFYFRNKYFNDFVLDVYIVERFTTNTKALECEKKWIKKLKPMCNKCADRVHEDRYTFSEKLKHLCRDLGYTPPERLSSKFDFRFLFTPKGLLCQHVNLGENSPFEYAEEKYYIRIKEDLHLKFPEYALQYIEWDKEIDGDMLESFHTSRLYGLSLEKGFNVLHKHGDLDWAIMAYQAGSFDFCIHTKGYYYEINSTPPLA